MSDAPEVRLALVVAGGVSLGAFNAGALTRLVELLEAHPAGRVRIDVLCGTSAGSLTLAVLLRWLAGGHDARALGEALARAGVTGVGLDYLDPGDPRQLAPELAAHDELGLLSSAPLRRAMRKLVLEPPRVGPPHPVLAPEVRCSFALANLHGFDLRDPARVGVTARGENPAVDAISTSWFDDTIRFAFRPGAASGQIDGGHLLIGDVDAHPVWEVFAEAARASGAFPVAFAPVPLSRQRGEYGEGWPEDLADQDRFTFVYADGGLFRNEPLEEALLQSARIDAADPRPHQRVLVVVDPNVRGSLSVRTLDHERDWNLERGVLGPRLKRRGNASKLLAYVTHLSRIIKYQAESKPALRLGLGQGAQVLSITPLSPPEPLTLAGAFMANFGGFLDESWRRQDLEAGRYAADEVLRRSQAGGPGVSPGLPALVAGGSGLPRPRLETPSYSDAAEPVRRRFDQLLRDHLARLAEAHGAPGVFGEWVGQAVMRYLERELKTPPSSTRFVTVRLGPVAEEDALLPAQRTGGAATPVWLDGQPYLETLLALEHCPRSLDAYRLHGPHVHADGALRWLQVGRETALLEARDPRHRIAIGGLPRTWFERAWAHRLLQARADATRLEPEQLS